MVLNKYLLMLGLLLIILPAVRAETYQSGQAIDYKTLCLNNGTYCSGSAVCNLTILYPNYSPLVSNGKMTNQVYYHNYTLASQSTLGTYTVFVTCTDNGYSAAETTSFDITPTGNNLDTSQGIFFIIVLVGLAGMFLFVGNSFDPSKWLIKSALFAGALLVMIIAINMGIQFSADTNTSKLMTTALIIGITSVSFFFGYVMVMYFINIIKAFKESKADRAREAEYL